MLEQTTEIQELSLEKVIETRLVQNNVTDQILLALKDKYGGMKLKALDDKESYLELKSAAKDCAKVRTLTTKLCKEGRERAVREQKLWIAKEKEIIGRVAEVEDVLDSEIKKFDDEIERKANEEKKRQEDAYINRQAALTKMGATYIGGSFVLGNASFEAELIKGASEDIWQDAIVPKFRAEYEVIEAARIEEERKREEAAADLRRQQEELQRQQQEFRQQQEEMQRLRSEAERIERERLQAEEAEKRRITAELQSKRLNLLLQYSQYGDAVNMATLWSLAESDFDETLKSKKAAYEAHVAEQQRLTEERRVAEIEAAKQAAIEAEQHRLQQEQAKKAEELAQASDKDKYADLISKLRTIDLPEMRSGQYRKKVQVIREKMGEILSL